LLDRLMPHYLVAEHHAIQIAAPAAFTFAIACRLDLQKSRLIRFLFKARELIMRSHEPRPIRATELIPWAESLGWGRLAEIPGRQVVFGAVTRPWEADVVFRSLPSENFTAFHEPGYVKIVWTLGCDSAGPNRSLLQTETRVAATDPASRSRFRKYWAIFSPGIILIRKAALRLARREAEQAWATHIGKPESDRSGSPAPKPARRSRPNAP
jgi:hypothetical protein